MIPVAQGDIVTVHYTGRLLDGQVFDASAPEQPLQFVVGKKEVIPGFEQSVIGMVHGEKRTITIPAEEAYGEKCADKIEVIQRNRLPANLTLQIGAKLEIIGHDDSKRVVEIVDLSDLTVTLDANHPLAGKELIFDIELLKIVKKPTLF